MYCSADISQDNVAQAVHWCIQVNDMSVFYLSPAWEHLRAEVLAVHKGECQICKARGFYRRASIVHHVKYVRLFPHLALSAYYTDEDGKEQKQLVPVCTQCHREIHNGDKEHKPRFTTMERWD